MEDRSGPGVLPLGVYAHNRAVATAQCLEQPDGRQRLRFTEPGSLRQLPVGQYGRMHRFSNRDFDGSMMAPEFSQWLDRHSEAGHADRRTPSESLRFSVFGPSNQSSSVKAILFEFAVSG